MTATATPANATAIAEALGRSFELVRTSVHRPNLRYDVERAENGEERLRALLRRLRALDGGAAIVYARSRRSCEEIARTLVGHGVRAEHYHAGLETEERTRVQEAFVTGRTPVVVATTAFGMGIDKADVRLVALVNFPDSLESYVQMVGRAGRDGRPSDTVLLAGDADATALRRFALKDAPTPELLRRVYRVLRETGGVVEPATLAGALGDDRDPRVLVGMLEQAGIVASRLRRRTRDAGRAAARRGAAPARWSTTCSTGSRARRPRGSSGSSRSRSRAAAATCRSPSTSTRRSRRPAARATSVPPRLGAESRRRQRRRSPTTPAAIVDAVSCLTWPLGRRSLVALLRGSVKAPPSRAPLARVRLSSAAASTRR